MASGSARTSSKKSSSSSKLVRNENTPSLKSQGAGYSTTNRKGETTFYKSSKDAPGYSDTGGTRATSSKGNAPISKFDSSGKAITASALAPSTPLNIPTKDQVTGVPDIAALNQGFVDPVTGVTADPSGKLAVTPVNTPATGGTDKYAPLVNLFNTYQQGVQNIAPPNTESIYTKEYKEAGIKKKQQAVSDYSAQLNTIVANRDANVLKLEGQGRGITDVIIGGQQAQVNKEAAIAALPVQAQLAAAQGNLELAQSHLETMFSIKVQDAQNQYNYKNKLLDSVYGFVSGIAQARIGDLKEAEQLKYQEKREFIKTQQSLLSSALAQGAPSSTYNAIKTATTAEEAIIAAGAYNGTIPRGRSSSGSSGSSSSTSSSVPEGGYDSSGGINFLSAKGATVLQATKKMFAPELSTKIVTDLTEEQLRLFMNDFTETQNSLQQSVIPDWYLDEWKKAAGVGESGKTARSV